MPARPNPASRGKPVQLSIRPGSDLDEELARRMDTRGRPAVVQRDLRRYYALLRAHRPALSPRDARRVYDVLEPLHFDVSTIRLIPELLPEITRGFTLPQLYALADAIEQARSESWPHPRQGPTERLEALGLLRTA